MSDFAGAYAAKKRKPRSEVRDESGSPDMVSTIMERRKAQSTPPIADEAPNEFDDLVLDDNLNSVNTGESSGDELGNSEEEDVDKDVVAKVMRSRRKKP